MGHPLGCWFNLILDFFFFSGIVAGVPFPDEPLFSRIKPGGKRRRKARAATMEVQFCMNRRIHPVTSFFVPKIDMISKARL